MLETVPALRARAPVDPIVKRTRVSRSGPARYATLVAVTDPIIVADGVLKRYGSNTVLSGATFTVDRGVTGLLGSNGAGKTTMLGMIMGLHRPDGGAIRVFGEDPATNGLRVRSHIGYAPEHHNLPDDLPASDFVQHIAEVHGLPTAAAVGKASDALWFVGLGEERYRPLGTLSTGQRQRVKLAMAIAHDPQLVLLDEPTDGLDPTQRETMLDLIRKLAGEFNMAVLLSSHLLDEVERTCSSVVILNGGTVTAAGDIATLKGAGAGMTVEVLDGIEPLAQRLVARGFAVSVDGPTLVVQAGATSLAQRDLQRIVRDDLAELQLSVRRLSDRVVTLEEIFMEVGT